MLPGSSKFSLDVSVLRLLNNQYYDVFQLTFSAKTNPSSFQSGVEYPEGTTVVYFVGTDEGGLSVTDYLTFSVNGRLIVTRFPTSLRELNNTCLFDIFDIFLF